MTPDLPVLLVPQVQLDQLVLLGLLVIQALLVLPDLQERLGLQVLPVRQVRLDLLEQMQQHYQGSYFWVECNK